MDSSLQTMRVLALCAMIAVANAAFNRLQVEIYCSSAVNGINWENGDEGAADEYQRRSCTQLATNMFYCKTDLFTSSTSTDSSSYLVHGSPGIINVSHTQQSHKHYTTYNSLSIFSA